jgi:hypothetical protein
MGKFGFDVNWAQVHSQIYAVTTSIVVMTAGDSGLQSEIVQDVI